MPDRYKMINGVRIKLTPEEETARELKIQKWESKSSERKLAEIKQLRLIKLQETDYLANSDMTMPEYIKTWRQSLRDLPQDNTTEEQYDLILARNENRNLTNAIWTQPTS